MEAELKTEGRELNSSRPSVLNYLALWLGHSLQEAQQSAESQHDAFAAFTAPAKPSAITAINTNACSFLMDFSPLKNQM